jgi:hypothetical protein
MSSGGIPPNPLDKPGYRLEFADEFDSSTLDLSRWLPYYLPQWSSTDRSAARYALHDNALVLLIDEDQPPWCPEFDGEVRCSSFQTGVYAGDVGSLSGQHRFRQTCVVREAQTTRYLYTPMYGFFEARVKAPAFVGNVAALWMIGLEETPAESGEIAIFELFGEHITPTASEVRYGVHPWGDANLTDAFYRDTQPFDASQFHIYAVEWTPRHIDFYVDNQRVRRISQSPAYPMQFMLGIYDLPLENKHLGDYPRRFTIDYFRAYQPEDGYKGI